MCIWIDVCLRHLLLLCECASLCSVMRLNVPIFECLDGGHVACLINFTSLSFSTARAQAGSNRNSRKERKRKNVYRTMVLGRRRRRRRTERRKEEKKMLRRENSANSQRRRICQKKLLDDERETTSYIIDVLFFFFKTTTLGHCHVPIENTYSANESSRSIFLLFLHVEEEKKKKKKREENLPIFAQGYI